MKKLFLLVLALSVTVLASEGSIDQRVDGLQAQVDRIMSKAGIHFNGEFRSQFLSSTISGDAVEDGKRTESVEYTSVDFDIIARPNAAFSARAMFRLHQDWRNFFSDIQNPITSRWVSIDGTFGGGIFKYSMGDFKKKLTPLTLWSPDLEFLYEPEIFAQSRELAMSEAFLGGNNRLLQGVNVSFKAELYPIVHEIEFDLFGARLATRGTGESEITAPSVGAFDAPFDKYLTGVNLAVQPVEGATIGLTNIVIFDQLSTYDGGENDAKMHPGYQSTNVIAGRVNIDNRMFMDDNALNIGLNFEAAYSLDRRYYREGDAVLDSNVTGMGLIAGIAARYSVDEANSFNLSVDFINNDRDFRNDAAQSPSFMQKAIMNHDNNLSGLGLMNPFDALYRSVFKYAPSQYFGGTQPYTKNAYNNATLTQEQIAQFYTPSVFQTALPGGPASSDRTGPVINFEGSFLDRAVSVGAKAAILNTVEDIDLSYEYSFVGPEDQIVIGTHSIPAFTGDFLEVVGGASFDIARFAPAIGPSLIVGGSFGMYNSKTGVQLDRERVRETESNSNLLSLSLNYRFHQRFNVLFGYQMLTTNLETVTISGQNQDRALDTDDFTFDNLAFGVGYRVADGGNITAKLTMVSGKRDSDGMEYKSMQPEVYLTVRF
ncbi:MAG: hypothetical protein LBC70_08890 [Chitinispirillales bacterium]|nr:hypothetical protein [Chitinispirillales bacterium]